jgi:predicted CoA-binding protein
VDECLAKGFKNLWLQEGIVNEAAAQRASDNGIQVVMDRCIWRDRNGPCGPLLSNIQ